jgi:di/tricarboxylate transporter
MHGSGEAASIGTMLLAAILFVITYVVVMTERVNRAIVALLAAGLMIILGILNQEAAIRGIDFNTIGLLIGMMVIVAITRQSGVFQYLAIWAAKKVECQPLGHSGDDLAGHGGDFGAFWTTSPPCCWSCR